MPFRDKPRLSERLRGKSGEELLNELKSDWDSGRRMFFEQPSWGSSQHNTSTFPRGFPFDEDRSRTNLRSYLDEFANRHPEFADQLRGPPWNEQFVNSSFNRKRRGSGAGGEESASSAQEPPRQQPREEEEEPRQSLNQFGLRNTVPLAQGVHNEEERRQRSMSAPPDSRSGDRPRRFQSKGEIHLQDPGNAQPAAADPQQQPQQNSARNVRVIPIQVEGRDEPIINNLDTNTSFASEQPSFEGRLPREFGSYQKHSPRFSQEKAPPPQQPFHQAPPPQPAPPPPQQHFNSAPPPGQPPTAPSADQTDSVPPPPPPTHKQEPKDPIAKVEIIQKDLDNLLQQVESFTGDSRKDKQYLYLDEMLTRNLIKLDDVDTEGKENVRQARKEAIRSVQRCISMLENKVPVSKQDTSCAQPQEQQQQQQEEQLMEVDRTKENTPVPGTGQEAHTMEVETPVTST